MPTTVDALVGGQAGDRAEHRQAVVAVRGDRAAAQPAGAAHDEAVLGRLEVAAQAAEAVDDGRDPVGLLEPQLAGRRGRSSRPRRSSPAARPAAARRSPAAPPRPRRPCRSAGRGRRRGRRSARWPTTPSPGALLELADDDAAHPLEDPQEARARPVVPLPHDLDPRAAATEHAGGDQERGRGRVAGHGDVVEDELVDAGDRDVAAVAVHGDARARRASARCGRARAPARRPSSRRRPSGRRARRRT